MNRGLAICAALVASSCTTIGSPTEMVTLIAPSQGDQMIRTCSREGPSKADSYFTPTPREITAIENGTMDALRKSRPDFAKYFVETGNAERPFLWAEDPSLYRRQYVGYVIDGQRMIYGNYLPATGSSYGDDNEPTTVCDGGPAFFGVEYSLDRGKVIRIAFNGGRGGPFLPSIEP